MELNNSSYFIVECITGMCIFMYVSHCFIAFTCKSETEANISPSSCRHIILTYRDSQFLHRERLRGRLSRATFFFLCRPGDLDRRDKSCRINNAIRMLNHIARRAFQTELNQEPSAEL